MAYSRELICAHAYFNITSVNSGSAGVAEIGGSAWNWDEQTGEERQSVEGNPYMKS